MKNGKAFNWKSVVSITITTVIGLVFLISGISKVFVLKSFSTTVAHFLPFLFSIAYPIAVGVVILEISLGFMLLVRYKLAISSFAISVLLTFFIGILMFESMTGSSIRCNCFGGLNISFPSKVQIVIDLIMLNGLIAVNFLHAKNLIPVIKNNWISWVAPALVVVILEILLIKSVWNPNIKSKSEDVSLLLSFVSQQNHTAIENQSAKKTFFLMSFYDFNCPLCYDDFLALSDSLQSKKYKNVNVIYLFERKSLAVESLDSTRLETWKDVNSIHFPVLLADNKLFEDYSIRKSSILILDENNQLVIKDQFPVGKEKRTNILHYLSN
ncbi:MAG: DoxX family protein [Ignavibacteriales bacterium]|nr:DoxX family protein [Ignavibacteriales bacterium]